MDSDEEMDFEPSWRGVTGTIILINAFQNSKHHIFETIHVAICRLIRQHMRLCSFQNISVCIFGTEESTASTFDSKPVVEIIPLSVPSLEDYNKLKKIDISSFNEAKELNISDVLWHCSKMFVNCKKQLSTRSVIILTRLDEPPIAVDQRPTLDRARDLVDSNIEIKVINIAKEEYKIDMFYEKFFKIANKGKDFVVPKPIWESAKIEQLMSEKSHRNLAVAKLNFEIGTDFHIGVGVYTLLKSDQYKKTYNLDRDTNTVLSSMTKTMKVTIDNENNDDEEASQPQKVPLIKSELLYYAEYGGERVEFTDSEMKVMKNPFGPPTMKLLGFKPAKIICKEKWYYKTGYFLFPNESIIEGSTVAFKALHKACKDMNTVAICVLCTRVNSIPVIVALSPCSKPLHLDIEIGFDVINIPFAETVRELKINEDENDATSVDEANKTLMKDIITKVLVDYKPDMFENPKLQCEYRALEEIALDDDDSEPLVDTTKQNPDVFLDIQDDLFEELFGPFGSLNLKRSATKIPFEGTKKQKVDDIDEELLNSRLADNKINLYTVAQLKQILKSKDIKNLPALTGLKKSELVELVCNNCC